MQTRSSTHKFSALHRSIVFMITLLVLISLTVSTAMAYDTPPSSPSRAATPGKSWKNISYIFASDNFYATATRNNKQLRLYNFTIPGIPGGATINGIEVTVEGLTLGLQANVALSYNGGSSYTSAKTTALTGVEATTTLGGPADNWGHSWNPSEFTNSNFMMKLTTTGATGNGITISVDQVQVKVNYTPPPTTIVLSPVSGLYGGTAEMTATLTVTATGLPIPSKTINFYVGGTGINSSGGCTGIFAGSATTQAGTGIATLASADLSGISAGDYPYGACASFAGDPDYQGTSISSDLNIEGTETTLVVAPASGAYGGTVNLSATLTLTSNGSPINNKFITFYLFGNDVGNAKTNSSGIATLNNVSLMGYDAGSSNDIGATFDGDMNLNPATAANALITISQRPITVTAVTDSKIYDGTVSSSGVPTYSAGALITGDTANFTQTFDTKHVGTGKTLTPGGVVDDGNSGLNYTYTFVPVTSGAIGKASLTVTADNKTMYISGIEPAYTFHYGSMATGDTSADIDVAPTCGVIGPHSLPGDYTIACSGGSDNDYSFSYVNGTLTVAYVHINVDIHGLSKGNYDLAVGASRRELYDDVDNGPTKVESTNGGTIIASERINLKNGVGFESYTEFLGLPVSKLSDTYIFPWYNNATTGGLSSQLRIANVGNVSTTVTIKIHGVAQNPTYNLAPNTSQRVELTNVDNGPVEVKSSGGVPILASMRINLKDGVGFESYTEFLGLSASSTASTRYLFPWYNNATTGGLESQLRFGNVGNATTVVSIKIAGVTQPQTYTLAPNESQRVILTNVDNGPVEVLSSGGVPIIAAMRANLKNNVGYESYSEFIGLPGVTLSETRYLFPWYNNATAGGVSSQLRFGNVGGATTVVSIKIAGVTQPQTYTLAPNESARVMLDNVDNGPVEVFSSGGVPIIASMRVNLKNGLGYSSYSEFMGMSVGNGLPGNELSTTYWFPWYNNATNGGLSSQLRFGVPEQ